MNEKENRFFFVSTKLDSFGCFLEVVLFVFQRLKRRINKSKMIDTSLTKMVVSEKSEKHFYNSTFAVHHPSK